MYATRSRCVSTVSRDYYWFGIYHSLQTQRSIVVSSKVSEQPPSLNLVQTPWGGPNFVCVQWILHWIYGDSFAKVVCVAEQNVLTKMMRRTHNQSWPITSQHNLGVHCAYLFCSELARFSKSVTAEKVKNVKHGPTTHDLWRTLNNKHPLNVAYQPCWCRLSV